MIFGNRIEKTVDSDGGGTVDTTERYAVEGWNPAKPAPMGTENVDVWADLDGNSSLTTRYLRGDSVDQLFARAEASDVFWYLTDHQGSIRNVLDDTGAVVKTVECDAFGNITSQSGAGDLGRYQWTGRDGGRSQLEIIPVMPEVRR